MTGSELLEKFMDQNNICNFECTTKNLKKIIEVIDPKYVDIDDFLSDNPGAQSAIIQFIEEWIDKVPEWKNNLEYETAEEEE